MTAVAVEMVEGHQLRAGDHILVTVDRNPAPGEAEEVLEGLMRLGTRWGVEFAVIWNGKAVVIHGD